VNLDLATARGMLPYVRSIVTEVVRTAERLNQLGPVQDAYDDVRRNLPWPSRQKRYAVRDEILTAEESLAEAVSELETLGLTLADRTKGAVEFPTRINNRPAAFSWLFGEDALRFWHYAGEDFRRPIPLDWQSGSLSRYRAEP